MKVLEAVFLTSVACAADVPRDCAPQVALVGRSNVGKSSLINALARRPLARTSAAPGKTRLANLYHVTLDGPGGGAGRRWSVCLVDLPGYGYAGGGEATRREFARLTAWYFDAVRLRADSTGATGADITRANAGRIRLQGGRTGPVATLLVLDARHPGLAADIAAWEWIGSLDLAAVAVATKIDKLGRAHRTGALEQMARALNSPVLAASAETGEGMDDLWKRIARLLNRHAATEDPPGWASRP